MSIDEKDFYGIVIEDTTLNTYYEKVDIINRHLGNRKVRELTFEDIEEFINTINEKVADSTVKQVRQHIVSMIYYAKKDGIIDENILQNEKLNIKEKKGKNKKKIIQTKEIPIFVNYCKEHKYNILVFLLGTGARASERCWCYLE